MWRKIESRRHGKTCFPSPIDYTNSLFFTEYFAKKVDSSVFALKHLRLISAFNEFQLNR